MAESKYYGIYQAKVSNVEDPEKRGRVKVLCPDVLGAETESAWCDPCVPVAYDGGGDFCLPAVDETLWIMFISGDSNRPVYFGNWWQKEKTPLAGNYTNLNAVRIISFADCIITMQNGVININVGAGVCDLEIKHNKVTVKGDLSVEGNITANSVSAGSVVASTSQGSGSVTANSATIGGINFNSHKHGGVESGSSTTGTPQ